MVWPRSRFLYEQRHRSDGWSAEAGTRPFAQESWWCDSEDALSGAGKFLSWPHVWRAFDHVSGEIPRRQRLVPLAPRITEADREAHRSFIATLSDKPIWNEFLGPS